MRGHGLDWQCCLAGTISKMAPTIFIFSIALGAAYLFYVESNETRARAFLTLIILSIGTVHNDDLPSLDELAKLLFLLFMRREGHNAMG